MDALHAHPYERAVAVAPIAVGRTGGSAGRGVTAVLAWALVLVGVIGLATIGRLADSHPSGPRTAAVVFDLPPPLPTAAPVIPPAPPMPDLIVLASPAEANATITSRALLVRGYVEAAAATVQVTLEARGNRIIDSATLRPALAFGERSDANRHPWFEVAFGLPNPRPNGRMIVQVAAYDASGQMIDVVRRPIRVGMLLDKAPELIGQR